LGGRTINTESGIYDKLGRQLAAKVGGLTTTYVWDPGAIAKIAFSTLIQRRNDEAVISINTTKKSGEVT